MGDGAQAKLDSQSKPAIATASAYPLADASAADSAGSVPAVSTAQGRALLQCADSSTIMDVDGDRVHPPSTPKFCSFAASAAAADPQGGQLLGSRSGWVGYLLAEHGIGEGESPHESTYLTNKHSRSLTVRGPHAIAF